MGFALVVVLLFKAVHWMLTLVCSLSGACVLRVLWLLTLGLLLKWCLCPWGYLIANIGLLSVVSVFKAVFWSLTLGLFLKWCPCPWSSLIANIGLPSVVPVFEAVLWYLTLGLLLKWCLCLRSSLIANNGFALTLVSLFRIVLFSIKPLVCDRFLIFHKWRMKNILTSLSTWMCLWKENLNHNTNSSPFLKSNGDLIQRMTSQVYFDYNFDQIIHFCKVLKLICHICENWGSDNPL